MSPTFDFLVKIDKIYVTSRHLGEMLGTLPTKITVYMHFLPNLALAQYSVKYVIMICISNKYWMFL